MIELTLLKVLMLIRQVYQKSILFVIIGIFLGKGFRFQPAVCNGFHNVLMVFIDFNIIPILNIYGVDYSCIIGEFS